MQAGLSAPPVAGKAAPVMNRGIAHSVLIEEGDLWLMT
jgi:hypothetical protein